MKRLEEERGNLFSRRALLIGTAQGALLSLLVARMYYIQVVEAKKYQLMSDDNRINVVYDPPIRGLIYDRNKVLLAENRQVYSLVFTPEFSEDRNEIFARLKKLINLTDEEITKAKQTLKFVRSYVPVQLREDLDWKQVATIEANAPNLPGVDIRSNQIRGYPIAEPMAHVVGYVGKAFPEDVQEQRDPVLLLPGFRIGRSGVEKSLESALRGNAGRRLIETNAIGKTIRVLQKDVSEHGLGIDLTIDSELQVRIHELLSKERSAAAVVMDVDTGAVRALVSAPSFNPNKFITGFTRDEWDGLRKDERSPFRNKALAGTYAPGSTFKMIVALAAMEDGLNPDELIRCDGKIELGNQTFHCWKKRGHGPTNLHTSLVESCDVYYYELAQRLGITKIAKMARRFGFGRKQMLAMVDERSGLMPDRAWKREKRDEGWRTGDTLISSIGQGFILATPVQLATMVANLVNGGFGVQPHLFKQDFPLPRFELGIPQRHLDTVIRSMNDVTATKKGTAFKARIEEPGLEMGGKTGTTQVRRISASEREAGIKKNEELPWNFRDHALFVGYAPVYKPKFACAVVVEHGGGGGSVAAPFARDILLETQIRDAISTGVAVTS
ncbi:MAG: penicillin-binding protein 2 [Alphaproteobacteria bacterium]